ncbi:unnamed protein product [Caenorhabditis angaria]|uniref:Uncharacterized protein n=1 Tax=Caenorhabditis angaria TaxID=860376 RepID=A0A9P1IJH3_9PELO|nr:unnamed protein product [Caenorhabditis angaria]
MSSSDRKRKSEDQNDNYPGPDKKAVPEEDVNMAMDNTQEDEEAVPVPNKIVTQNPQIFDPSLDVPFTFNSDRSETDLSPIELVAPPSLPPPSPPPRSPISPRRSRSEPTTPSDGEPLSKKLKFPPDLCDIRDRSKRDSAEIRQVFKESFQEVVDLSKVTERSERSQQTSPVLTLLPVQRAQLVNIPQLAPEQTIRVLPAIQFVGRNVDLEVAPVERVEYLDVAQRNTAQNIPLGQNVENVQLLAAQPTINARVADIVVAAVQVVQFAPPPPPQRELDDLDEVVAGPPPPAAPLAPQPAPLPQQPPQVAAALQPQPPQVAAPPPPPQVAAPPPPPPPPSPPTSGNDWVKECEDWLAIIQRCFDAVIRGQVTNQTIDAIQSLTRCRSTLRRWVRAQPAESDDKMDKMIQRISRAKQLVPKLK